MPIVVARCHHVHLVCPDRRPQRQIVQVHVYRKIRIVTGGGQVVVIVRRWRGRCCTHIGGGVRRQSGAIGRRRRRIRRGVVRGEVLASISTTGAAAGTGRAAGASGHRLRAPEALGQPGVAAHELPVFLPHLQWRSKPTPRTKGFFLTVHKEPRQVRARVRFSFVHVWIIITIKRKKKKKENELKSIYDIIFQDDDDDIL